MFYALTVTFAGIDWIMSLNPHWYSTIFGFLMMGGQGLAALAFTVVVSTFLFKREPMSRLLKPHHFHDLGKLMFAFVMLWAYFNFSQYLLTFAANLVEEIPYMITRTSHGWQYLALFLMMFHFAVPWFLLLSRNLKRTPHRLVIIACWMLFVRFADIYMLVSPEFDASGENLHLLAGEHASHFFVHWLDLAAPLAIGGLWLWMFFTRAAAAAAARRRRSRICVSRSKAEEATDGPAILTPLTRRQTTSISIRQRDPGTSTPTPTSG